jgi:hypothetical protein
MLLIGGCSHPGVDVPQEPPPRPATQTSDLPPTDFLEADLVVTVSGKRQPYCFGVDELLAWLKSEEVRQQDWTQIGDRGWRLDGYAYKGKEHTVWVFEKSADGVELVGYKDSADAARTPESIMKIYYPRMTSMHVDVVRMHYGTCKDPYD